MQKEVQANKLPDLTLSTEAAPADAGAAGGAAAAAERRGRRGAQLLPDARLDRRAAGEGGRSSASPSYREPVGRRRLSSSRARPPAGAERPQRRPERQAGPLLRHARGARSGSSASATGSLTVPVSGVARNMIGDQAAIGLDAVVLYSTPALLARLGADTGLQQPRVPARRHEQGGRRPDRRAARERT